MDIYEKVNLDKDMPMKFYCFNLSKGRNQNINKHWHRSIEILVPLEGRFYIWISGRTIEVNAGEIFIVNSREIHSISGEGKLNYKGYMIQIGYDFLLSCFKDMDSIYFRQIEDIKIKGQIIDTIERIKYHYEDNDEHKRLAIEVTPKS